ncbi:MAG TPA: hypothetical protein VGW10_05215, partial [Solirubrobacteraceae bacterium]|nr:hypothetical protein [Solirubrobacteraceae bacterium]
MTSRALGRLLLAAAVALLMAAPAQAAPRWSDGVLACEGAPVAPVAGGTAMVPPPAPRRARGARCVSASLPVA